MGAPTHRQGYYRYPTVHGRQVVFVAEDDLWTVSVEGGDAHRLTALRAAPLRPQFTPDGRHIVFTGREEGVQDLYVIPAEGGDLMRLTYFGSSTFAAGFLPDGRVVVATDARSPFLRWHRLFAVALEGGEPEPLPYGRATDLAFGPGGKTAIGRRNFREYAYWKRYDGGTAGQIWIDATGEGRFRHFDTLHGDQECPMWVGERLYFLSAHEGVGNLYSVTPDGGDLRRHSDHVTFYARNASADASRVVYHAGGDLYVLDPGAAQSRRIEVTWHGMARERERRFVGAAHNLREFELAPKGASLGIVTRGKPFLMGNWEGPVLQLGEPQGTGYRLLRFLPDGRRVVVVSDRSGEEGLEIYAATGDAEAPRAVGAGAIGRPYDLQVSPRGDRVALTNHRMEVLVADLEKGTVEVVDRSEAGRVRHLAWSPDGRWLAYSYPLSVRTAAIRLYDTERREATTVTRPVLRDYAPVFDPKGRYLYFLGVRVYNPVYDDVQFALGFPGGERPYLIPLRRTTENPFLARPRPLSGERDPAPPATGAGSKNSADAETADAQADAADREGQRTRDKDNDEAKDEATSVPAVEIDLDGIADRVLAFPVPEGRYGQIAALDEKVLFTRFRPEGVLSPPERLNRPNGELWAYDLREQTAEMLAQGVSRFVLSYDRKTLAYASGERLRVVRAGERVEGNGAGGAANGGEFTRKTGWIDLGRVKVAVDPPREWRQMLREAWRNMRDHFWTEDMSGVDWSVVYERYRPLLERIASREEVWDLLWEMQGELGTSHAYVRPAETSDAPAYPGGALGAEFVWDRDAQGYRVTRIVTGDTWSENEDSPLRAPGVGLEVGDVIRTINGQRLDERLTPEAALVNLAGVDVQITFVHDSVTHTATVRTLKDETMARYREWVEQNRAYVHAATQGRVGYVHVPNMMGLGFAEFHRGFLAESQRDALIVDVRFNSGGHVSQLLIERLRRRVIAYQTPRWGRPATYPAEAVLGPMVCLTNEGAGSDGDIFSQAFRTYGLGPLIGTRTWGGVIGISGERSLVDQTVTTQPEFSFWFEGPGWGVENHGVEPDIVVEDPPEDGGRGKDAQLERAVEEILRLLEAHPVVRPDLTVGRPRRTLPTGLSDQEA